MRLFDTQMVEQLKPYLDAGDITFIGLGKYDFQCAFDRISLQNTHRVSFRLNNNTYEWNEGGTCEAPVWSLIGQVPLSCSLIDKTCMEIRMKSGDAIRLYTDEGPYESGIFSFPPSGGSIVTEVY